MAASRAITSTRQESSHDDISEIYTGCHSGGMSAWRTVPEIAKVEFLTENQKQQILGGNAARLLGLG